MKLCLRHLDMFAARTRSIEVLDELDKLGVDILSIDGPGTSLCDVCFQLLDIIVVTIAFRSFLE